MKPKRYEEFVAAILDEIECLSRPTQNQLLAQLLSESELTGLSREAIEKAVSGRIAKYDRMIGRTFISSKNSNITWNDAVAELDKLRRGKLARIEAQRSLKIRKLLSEGATPPK